MTHDSSRTALVEPAVLLIFLAYFSHKAGLASIVIDATQIAVNPSWYDRKLFGAQPKNVAIIPGSELLFCRQLGYGALIGYDLRLRIPNESDHVLWNYANNLFSCRRRVEIADEARKRFVLPVRSLTQDTTESGVVETVWAVGVDKQGWRNIKWALIPGLSPWLGVAVGFLTSDLRKIALVGASLWVCGGALLWAYSRISSVESGRKTVITLLVWTLQFIPLYLATALATSAIKNR